ncbi:hypothetical protein D3C78_1255880 [compost metagenome]
MRAHLHLGAIAQDEQRAAPELRAKQRRVGPAATPAQLVRHQIAGQQLMGLQAGTAGEHGLAVRTEKARAGRDRMHLDIHGVPLIMTTLASVADSKLHTRRSFRKASG